MKAKLLLCLCLILACTNIFAQERVEVSGIVTEQASGFPAIGVSVLVKGTTQGTITSIDGDYSIPNVPSDATLVFSYIGMISQEVTVNGRTRINILMEEDTHSLEEVVVIGYGSAKAKDLTSPITTISSESIAKQLTASPMQGLQGKVSGIQVINTGQPGSSPRVRMRGVGSYNDEGPLYVVDGMFFDDISFLSNGDIESLNVLKDASASAIYGVRAANGVIIITTKRGIINTKPEVSYDGYVGVQTATNKMKMANSEQYTMMMREAGLNHYAESSIARFGGANGIPSTNTDWYDELLKTALMHSHNVNVNGGTDVLTYSVGANYLSQDGIMDKVDNGYERLNTRLKMDLRLMPNLRVGANMIMTSSTQQIAPNDAWGKAFTTPSILPVYDENNTIAYPEKFASPGSLGYDEYFGNPVASAFYENNSAKVFQVMPSFYAELSLLEDRLTFRSSFSQSITNTRNLKYIPEFAVSTNQRRDVSLLERATNYQNNYIIDNVLTYRETFGIHNITAMVGSSVRKDRYERLFGSATDVPNSPELWYLSQGAQDSRISNDAGQENRGASFFGRFMYNLSDKYLLSATLRADGSSKYQEKWGYFPSLGLGWVPSQEGFMQNQSVVEFLKFRGSWGKLGNDKIVPNSGFSSITQNLGTTGVFGDTQVVGNTNVSYFNYLKWEVVEEINAGFDFSTLNNRLSGEFDYYKRTTTNAVFDYILPFGAGSVKTNNGEIVNSGIEMSLNWNDRITKDFSYNVGFNLTTLKNEVTYLNGVDRIPTGSAEFRTYRMLGQPIDAFYGYKVVGVYQNDAQVAADPVAVKNGLKPGDFIYEDLNNDGEISDADKQIIGSKLPNLYIGGNLGFEYKKFDFNMAFNGQFGHKITNRKRGLRRWQNAINFDENLVLNRWTGEGSTNSYPSAAGYINPWNITNFNSFFTENASTVTIQNIQAGYTFQNVFAGSNKSTVRVSFTAERPFSFFSYNGFTTDIPDGFDELTYPLASTFSFGVKITY
jgi:TonB-linked outer membrane protein, SusC/RagA family